MSSALKPRDVSHFWIHVAQQRQSRNFTGSAPTVSKRSSSKYSSRMEAGMEDGVDMAVPFRLQKNRSRSPRQVASYCFRTEG